MIPRPSHLVAAGVCAVFLSFVAFSDAAVEQSKEPIKIGINLEMTGVMSETSMNAKMGYDLYLQEIGYKIAGRPIKVIEYDNKTDPKISVEVAQKLVEKDRVHMVLFGTNSAAAIAVRGYMEKAKVPMIVVGMAGAERVTLPGNDYIFRLGYADGQVELPLGRYAYEKLGYRKMALMGPDYAGSHGKLWAFQQEFEKSGGKIVQTILWPLGEMDLAPYFARLNPDVEAIFPFIPGDISINRFISQYFELGLDKKAKLCTHWTFTADYFTLKTFKEKMIGVSSGGYYALSFDSPENKRLTAAYYAKYGNKKLMNSDVATGYESMKFICTALEAIKGKVEDTDAFLKAMRSTKIKGLVSGTVSVDGNGNVVRDVLILQARQVGNEVRNVVLDVIPQVRQPPQGYTVMPGK
ncbi:MAG: ABC transporter substrate-binding protein [Deltaproteobacteria bacterium]|nr:ABC transporter substrate-binding protein [Deltaproteobacteria bacterium]